MLKTLFLLKTPCGYSFAYPKLKSTEFQIFLQLILYDSIKMRF